MLSNEQIEQYFKYLIEMNEFMRLTIEDLRNDLKKRELAHRLEIERIENSRPLTSWERKKVKNRDNNQCVKCSDDEQLQVHHIIPLKEGGLNDDDNLITLCLECHIKEHEGEVVERLMRKQL